MTRAGVDQTDYDLDRTAQRVTFPVDGTMRAGDKMRVRYPYHEGEPLVDEEPITRLGGNGATSIGGAIPTLALPGGVQQGDLLVVAATARETAYPTDRRLTSVRVADVSRYFAWGYQDSGPTDALEVGLTGSGSGPAGSSVTMYAFRGIQVVGDGGVYSVPEASPYVIPLANRITGRHAIVLSCSHMSFVAGVVTGIGGFTTRRTDRRDYKGSGVFEWGRESTSQLAPNGPLSWSGSYNYVVQIMLKTEELV